MLKTIKLSSVNIVSEKDDKPMKDKNGNLYVMVYIEWEGKKASMYCGEQYGKKKLEVIKTWTEGQEVEVSLEQSGKYLNFDIPTKTDVLEQRIERLENKVFCDGRENISIGPPNKSEELSDKVVEDLPF